MFIAGGRSIVLDVLIPDSMPVSVSPDAPSSNVLSKAGVPPPGLKTGGPTTTMAKSGLPKQSKITKPRGPVADIASSAASGLKFNVVDSVQTGLGAAA